MTMQRRTFLAASASAIVSQGGIWQSGEVQHARQPRALPLADGTPSLDTVVAGDLLALLDSLQGGQRQGKREFIDGWTAPGDRFNPITLVDRVVTPLGGDAGMVSAETVLSGTSDGKSFVSRIRFTDTFRRVAGEWRAVHIQVTRIPEPPTK